jgi:hypothetical protein
VRPIGLTKIAGAENRREARMRKGARWEREKRREAEMRKEARWEREKRREAGMRRGEVGA